MTTIETITTSQLESLRDEAATAGDRVTYDLAVLALEGIHHGAVAACVEIIRDAEAMQD